MTRRASSKSKSIVPGAVDEYIGKFPEAVQVKLRDIRAAIRESAPDATETVSYFQMPGYCYDGYDYNGMFAWFSYKSPNVRLHVRPPVLEDNKVRVQDYSTTKAIISFPQGANIPKPLVKRLVNASIEAMKREGKSA